MVSLPVILMLKKPGRDRCKFNASMVYIGSFTQSGGFLVKPCLKNIKTTTKPNHYSLQFQGWRDVQWLRAGNTLAEDLGSVSRTRMAS